MAKPSKQEQRKQSSVATEDAQKPLASPTRGREHALLAALLRATQLRSDKLLWSIRRFDEQWLRDELDALLAAAANGAGQAAPISNEAVLAPAQNEHEELRARSAELAQRWSQGYQLSVARLDDLRLRLNGVELVLPRWLIGEMLGALGSNILPTQARARRLAVEAARECAYFGYGPLREQVASNPLAAIQELLAEPSASSSGNAPSLLFLDLRPRLGCAQGPVELLKNDDHFHRPLHSDEDFQRFQERLREDPLDGTMVERLRAFFSKRATAGVRDAMRWLLGARHPWFAWKRARALLLEAFEEQGRTRFVNPRLVIYCIDPSLGDEQWRELEEHNAPIIEHFAAALGSALGPLESRLLQSQRLLLAEAMLDVHHDHPDFDLEAIGAQGAQTHASFWTHGLSTVLGGIAGKDPSPRRNFKLQAHFRAMGWTERWLSAFSDDELDAFFAAAESVLRQYAKQGITEGNVPRREYRRPPTMLLLFEATCAPDLPHPLESEDSVQAESAKEIVIDGAPAAAPLSEEQEKLVDSFTLNELGAPQHAHHLRSRALIDKLVVFFALVLRQYLETQHAPDLRPTQVARDFLLLGLWGTNTSNVRVDVYASAQGKRFDVRYVGHAQVKAYRLALDRQDEAALARLAFSQLGPLIEPSTLRALGNFLMAAEEISGGARAPSLDRLTIVRHGLEIFRETARIAVKGSLVDTATAVEMMIDSGVDGLQRGLDGLVRLESSLSNRWSRRA
ncbi:MAG: hypothetical protein RBU37_17815 [Myxococcota bacterium]|nr:hypothetical protein [Myxococcota bacterium]